MKKFLLVAIVLCLLVLPAAAQQTQPPVLDTPVQYNSVNTSANSGGTSNPAVVTINGVTGQKIRVYWVAVACGATNTNLIPTLGIAGGTTGTLPGLTFLAGETVTITGNSGGACANNASVQVQADQF